MFLSWCARFFAATCWLTLSHLSLGTQSTKSSIPCLGFFFRIIFGRKYLSGCASECVRCCWCCRWCVHLLFGVLCVCVCAAHTKTLVFHSVVPSWKLEIIQMTNCTCKIRLSSDSSAWLFIFMSASNAKIKFFCAVTDRVLLITAMNLFIKIFPSYLYIYLFRWCFWGFSLLAGFYSSPVSMFVRFIHSLTHLLIRWRMFASFCIFCDNNHYDFSIVPLSRCCHCFFCFSMFAVCVCVYIYAKLLHRFEFESFLIRPAAQKNVANDRAKPRKTWNIFEKRIL